MSPKTTIGTRLRDARIAHGFDQAKLSTKIDVASRTLQRWEKGEQVPDSLYLMRLSKALGVTNHWLLTGETEQTSRSNVIHLPNRMKKVNLVSLPLLSSVPGGVPRLAFASEYAEKYVTVDDVKDPNAFALEVKGNSMSPRIENGDIVIVAPRMEVRTGDVCVVRVQEEDTLKKIKIDEQYVQLIPFNTEFEPMVVRKRDVTFMWRVVKVIKNL